MESDLWEFCAWRKTPGRCNRPPVWWGSGRPGRCNWPPVWWVGNSSLAGRLIWEAGGWVGLVGWCHGCGPRHPADPPALSRALGRRVPRKAGDHVSEGGLLIRRDGGGGDSHGARPGGLRHRTRRQGGGPAPQRARDVDRPLRSSATPRRSGVYQHPARGA